MKYRRIHIPIYGGSVLLFSDRDEYAKVFAIYDGKRFPEPISEGTNGRAHMTVHDGGRTHFIGCFDGDLGTLAHETLHTTFDIADHVGLDYVSGGSNEALTYLNAWLFRTCRNELNRVAAIALTAAK